MTRVPTRACKRTARDRGGLRAELGGIGSREAMAKSGLRRAQNGQGAINKSKSNDDVFSL